MKINQRRSTVFLAIAGGFVVLASALHAAPFVFNSRDLMLCFRKAQRNGGTLGPYQYEINIGQASLYYGATPGSTLPITSLNSNQMAAVFDSLNNVSWSVGGAADQAGGGIPIATLWVTKKRTTLGTQSTPPTPDTQGAQFQVTGDIGNIGGNAAVYSSLNGVDPINNTATNVRVPTGSTYEYGNFMGLQGKYNGDISFDVEATTSGTFTSGSNPSRIDLYEMQPGAASSTYLGYFDFNPIGTVSFTAAGGINAPTITSISRDGTSSILTFPSAASTVYNLRYTNSAGLLSSMSNWPVVLNVVTGNGSVKTITNVSTDPNRFYRLEAHP